jgi:hypothetical protein
MLFSDDARLGRVLFAEVRTPNLLTTGTSDNKKRDHGPPTIAPLQCCMPSSQHSIDNVTIVRVAGSFENAY